MTYVDEWRRWHRVRTDALSTPYGPLSALCVSRVRDHVGDPAARPVPVLVPGARHTHADWSLRLERVPLSVVDGSGDDGSDPQQRLLDAEGIGALHAIEDRLQGFHFGGLEVFGPHHDWVLPARVRELGAHEIVRVEAPRSDDRPPRWLTLDVSIHFEIDRRPFTLAATREPRGAFHAVFSDATRGSGFPYRHVYVAAPDTNGDAFIDFNRAVLPVAALTTRFPFAVVPRGNHIDVPVTAGEHRLYLDEALDQQIPTPA